MVGQPVREAIHRARDRHGVHLVTPSPQVLHRRQQPWSENAETTAVRHAGTNLTMSPGVSRLAGDREGSNITAAVRPISCQPPGVSIG